MHILEIGADQEDEASGARAADAAFRTVPRDHTTFLVWRVTESGTELLPRNHYGTYYDAEAYLVYSSSLSGQPAGPDVIRREIKENGNGEFAERHIHAWAGERSGTLAALALRRGTQLVAHLGAPAVIHRETAGKETPRLLSYFRDGIRILRSGSVAAGGARLYRVRGRRPVLMQLEPVSWAQLAADGVFLLDAAPLLVLWLGRAANLVEKIFGAKIAYRMARGAEKGITARRIAIAHDGYEQTLPASDRALLDALLELRARVIRPAAPAAPAPRSARLYRVTTPPRTTLTLPSQRPPARLEEIKRAPLCREDMADDGVYILDSGVRGVWAWVGPTAGGSAARNALAAARGLARARRYSGPVALVPAGKEPLEFAALFKGWRWADARRDSRLRAARSATTRLDAVSLTSNSWLAAEYSGPVALVPAGKEPLEFAALFKGWRWADARRDSRLRAACSATTRLDAVCLTSNSWLAAEAQLPDDGSGALRMWRVHRSGDSQVVLMEVERPQAAVFYSRDCYLALYTYHAPTGEHSILYYWMGGSSPNDLRNLGAIEAKDLYIKLGRLPIQAWIYQGKEPAHFLQIFKGRMITYLGSATDYDPTGRRVVAPSRALIRVSGQYAREARGIEVRGAGAGTGAGSCYVVREGARTWVWCAAGATGDEREVAKNMAAADHTLVMQGKEKPAFWTALGERRHLLVAAPLKGVERPLPPRLFYVSLCAPGQYTFEEIISFSQYELAPEMAAVLDAHCSLFVWLGAHADPRARDDARGLALAYLDQDPAARDPETPILVLSQGREPPNFTGFFPHWKQTMWKGHKTFSAIVSALEGKSIVQCGNSALQSGNSANRFDQYEKYPIAVLRGPKEHLPPDVDPLTKELYLTHDDFVATFGATYNEFRTLPAWKQKDLKKAVGLF